MNLATTLEVCNTLANPLTANLAKAVAHLCPLSVSLKTTANSKAPSPHSQRLNRLNNEPLRKHVVIQSRAEAIVKTAIATIIKACTNEFVRVVIST